MGYLGYVYVESKSFDFRSNVPGGVRLEERSKGLSRSVIMAWPIILWLLVAWDSITPVEKAREKWRSFRFGSKVYVLLRRNNRFGNFLELSEYGEKGRRSFIIIPEGEDGKGWTNCHVQLSKLEFFHDKQKLGGTSPDNYPGKPAAGPVGGNKGKTIISSYQTSLQGGKKSYAEVVQGMEQSLCLNFQTVDGKNNVSEAALEEINGRNSLVHALSADMEEKEKATIMSREEQVGVESVRDMLSDFKKDILKSLEEYLAGWTPPSAAVNLAKKGAVIGGPRLRREKPKLPIKLTYFRKKPAKPLLRWQKIERPAKAKKHGPESGLTQPIKFSGARRILEKGENSGTRPCPASPLNLVSQVIDFRGSIEVVESGKCRLSPEMEEP